MTFDQLTFSQTVSHILVVSCKRLQQFLSAESHRVSNLTDGLEQINVVWADVVLSQVDDGAWNEGKLCIIVSIHFNHLI